MSFDVVIVDDEDVSELVGNIELKGLNYNLVTPENFSNDIDKITDKYDLIIMDQKLAGNIGKIPYMGTTLIQELRTRMAEARLAPKPIILWSIAGNITSYQHEKTSHNLVDAVWKKEWLHISEHEKRKECASEVVALIRGYKLINESISEIRATDSGGGDEFLARIFGKDPSRVKGLVPESVFNHLSNKNNQIAHYVSGFMINAVLRFDGFLIDECTLAARLGVDKGCSQWECFKNQFLLAFKYEGLFSEYYHRWWAPEFENWWLDEVSEIYPASLSADERTRILNEKFSLSLSSAKLSHNHTEDHFWHCCIIDKVPLDALDAFKVTSSERREWQDQFYVCYDAVAALKHKVLGYELSVRDRERFLKIRKQKKNNA
ncbi:hypothetical protein [Marinobacter vinifirmus]|uniref:Uncharacterized protein n=1 Tax=Marinobacter vinifirmus TaxID=355591 RepID=A0A558B862_9GAMM|nr:hypothetical protein [Marinobacter vinifirmus]TVT32700.1 MAG: hypothetical protein FHK81_11590 [Marinobacter vinifirmus]